MILVTLGTQDKNFERLLKTIDMAIDKGIIKEEVIAQAGYTKYDSKNMKVFDFVSTDELTQLVKDARILITHGGVGSILEGLKLNKPIIAIPRLKKYKEHTNDHQLQIIDEFADLGYLLPLKDLNQFEKVWKKAQTFHPKKWKSNSSHVVDVINTQIKQWDDTSSIAKGRKYREVMLYLVFGGLTTVVNIIGYTLLTRAFHMETYLSNGIAWFISVLFAYLTNRAFVFESDAKGFLPLAKEAGSFFGFRLLSLGFDMAAMYAMVSIMHWNDIIAKVISNIVVIILNYVFSKLFIFRKKEVK